MFESRKISKSLENPNSFFINLYTDVSVFLAQFLKLMTRKFATVKLNIP